MTRHETVWERHPQTPDSDRIWCHCSAQEKRGDRSEEAWVKVLIAFELEHGPDYDSLASESADLEGPGESPPQQGDQP